MQSDWPTAFSFITWERDFSKTCSFCRMIKTTTVHHVNPKIAHQWSNFLPTLKILFLKIFMDFSTKITFFLGCITFLFLRNQNYVRNLIKILSAVFWEIFVLTTWLTGWHWCFHKTPLCLNARSNNIIT